MDHYLANSNFLAPPVKSEVWIIIPVINFVSLSYSPKLRSPALNSKFLIKLKCSVISVYKILEINNFLKLRNSSFEKLAKKLVSGSQSILIEVAA